MQYIEAITHAANAQHALFGLTDVWRGTMKLHPSGDEANPREARRFVRCFVSNRNESELLVSETSPRHVHKYASILSRITNFIRFVNRSDCYGYIVTFNIMREQIYDGGEDCFMRSYVTYTLHQNLVR
jgi:hypothetical protein